MLHRFTFRKPEHLCLQRDIELLFSKPTAGGSLMAYPLRVVWRRAEEEGKPQVKVLISVSKRRLRHAVNRNRAKRQVREAYRLQKYTLLNALPADRHLHIGFLWVSNKEESTSLVMRAVRRALHQIAKAEAEKKEAPSATIESHKAQ